MFHLVLILISPSLDFNLILMNLIMILICCEYNFPENMVGKGGHRYVYRVCLPDGKELAVKISKPSEDALKEFASEIEIITMLHHKNIISLFRFCFEENSLLLVYDFLSRGSLEENLHVKYFFVINIYSLGRIGLFCYFIGFFTLNAYLLMKVIRRTGMHYVGKRYTRSLWV